MNLGVIPGRLNSKRFPRKIIYPLNGKSVKEDGLPQKFPDFTRGNWKSTKPLDIIS